MKLRQKLSDGEQLRGNRGYACADNRPDNEPLNVHTYMPQQKKRSLHKIAERFYSSKAWT
jgi:hypothetical protein